MPAITASDQVLMLPIEIRPLVSNVFTYPADPGIGAMVSFFQAQRPVIFGFWAAGTPQGPPYGSPKCEIPTGQGRTISARLPILVADLTYGRRDRSEFVGGGRRYQTPAMAHPSRHQPLAQRPGYHCAGR